MIGTLTPNALLTITATSSRRNFCSASVQTVVPPTSLYEVLRVNKTASRVEIKAAYRDLAKVYHPDLSQSDGRDFIEINEAYSTLSDPTARAVYDMKMDVGVGTEGWGYGYGHGRVLPEMGNGSVLVEYYIRKRFLFVGGDKRTF